MDELYALYRRCFPDYPAAEAVFRECLKRERGQVLYAGEGGETVGYALIHGGSLSLLCVDRRYRNRGHGAALLEAAETRIRASGADRVLLGRGRYYLLQGVPAEDPAVPAFFERRGYAASWTSVNMRLDLRGFGAGRLDIPPAPETVGFRFAPIRSCWPWKPGPSWDLPFCPPAAGGFPLRVNGTAASAAWGWPAARAAGESAGAWWCMARSG